MTSATNPRDKIRIQSTDFDVGSELASLRAGDPTIGATATFVGLVRDLNDARDIAAMELEHYPGMTERAIEQIVAQARTRWKLNGCTVIHRVGRLYPVDQIVLVAVASAHRQDAFAACEFIMDFLKTSAPIWKKEATAEGEYWVAARASDNVARDRWNQPD
ncbi:MAG: molybdopterin synthase catalytic subunit MoaE [Pseudomonadota bacterium]